MNKKLLGASLSVSIMILTGLAYAQDHGSHHQMQMLANEQQAGDSGSSVKAVNVGNKICPVSGERVDQGGMEPATYEYNEKIYNFCCTSCVEEFKKDPQKYILKVEEELKSENQEEPVEKMDMNKEGNMPMDMHGSGHK